MKNIENGKLREQVVKNVLVHELMRVERKGMLELSKSYHRRRRKRAHAGLEVETFKTHNDLRATEALLKISNEHDLDKVITNVLERAR